MTAPLRALAAVTALLLLAGCGSAVENVAENAVERAIENEVGGDANVDVDEDSVTIESEEGSITAGSGSVPDDFPSDVRLVDGEVTYSQRLETADGRGWSVQVSVDGDAASVADQVRSDLTDAGFSVDESTEFTTEDNQGATILADRADMTALVVVTSEGSGTVVIYTLNEQAAQ